MSLQMEIQGRPEGSEPFIDEYFFPSLRVEICDDQSTYRRLYRQWDVQSKIFRRLPARPWVAVENIKTTLRCPKQSVALLNQNFMRHDQPLCRNKSDTTLQLTLEISIFDAQYLTRLSTTFMTASDDSDIRICN